jgi:broad specificity phosphatase PhoE
VQGTVPPERRLVLVRHARSSHVQTGWIDAAGFRAWREAYEAAGIVDGQRPPADLEALARQAGAVVCSDAARAVATARLLAGGREVLQSPLLRELDLVGPELGRCRLPLTGWALAVGSRMLALKLRGQYPPAAEAARIDAAATWLQRLAAEHALIVAVTHGSFRRQLANRLVRAGWRADPGRRSMRHWSAWAFTRHS